MASLTYKIEFNLRDCTVDGKPGYFHCWEHYSRPVEGSLMIGGAPPGVISFVRGIVEFPEGIDYVSPHDIKFCDEDHASLCAWDKFVKEKEKDHAKN